MSLVDKEMLESAKPESLEAPPAAEPQSDSPPADARPEYIPEKFWDAEAKQPRTKDLGHAYTELMRSYTQKSEDLKEQLRQEDLAKKRPVSPEEYGVDYGEPIKVPPNAKLDVSQDNPLVKSVQEWAHKNGVPKEAYQQLLRMYVENEVKGIPDFDAEMASLGDNARQRIGSLVSRAKAVLNDDEMDAFTNLIMSAKQVEVLEKVIGAGRAKGPQGFDADSSATESLRDEMMRLKNTNEYWSGDKYTRDRVQQIESRLHR